MTAPIPPDPDAAGAGLAPSQDPLARLPGESDVDYVVRLRGLELQLAERAAAAERAAPHPAAAVQPEDRPAPMTPRADPASFGTIPPEPVVAPPAAAVVRPLRPSVRPEGRRAVAGLRSAGAVGRNVRDAVDRRGRVERRSGTDRRAGGVDLRPEHELVERRSGADRRDVGTRDRRWVPERRRRPSALESGGPALGNSAVAWAVQFVFWVALIALLLAILL